MSQYKTTVTDLLKNCLLALTLITVIGCSNTLEVEGDFPRPVINILPLTVGVVYNEPFKTYRYVEQEEERNDWEISIGRAQMKLFNTVLPAMFSKVIGVPEINASSEDVVDLFFEPSVEEFQFNVPEETKIKMYEVWIKYNMKVYDARGSLLADWIITAYGKTPTEFMKSDKTALNEALIIALRDVGAGLSLRFRHVPEIQAWMGQRGKVHQTLVVQP
ncbi:MAG: hypothetical protein HRU22_17270 [Gammaproteobacteria bacterium]|nr:hypothetical protein [Gammaproteobacteria bacterium]